MIEEQYTTPVSSDLVIDVAEAARRLKVHPDTVYALIRAGRLPAKRLGKQRALRVSVRALEAFLSEPD